MPSPPKTVTTPAGVMRPIASAPVSVNHRLPSGPVVMSVGSAIPLAITVAVPTGNALAGAGVKVMNTDASSATTDTSTSRRRCPELPIPAIRSP